MQRGRLRSIRRGEAIEGSALRVLRGLVRQIDIQTAPLAEESGRIQHRTTRGEARARTGLSGDDPGCCQEGYCYETVNAEILQGSLSLNQVKTLKL